MTDKNINKKLILTRLLKVMGIIGAIFTLFVLLSSINVKLPFENTVFISFSGLSEIKSDIRLISGRPIAIVNTDKATEKWLIFDAINASSSCVMELEKNRYWYDRCSLQKFTLEGIAMGEFANLKKLNYKKLHNGIQISL